MEFDIISSLVTYRNDPVLLKKTVESFLTNKLRTRLFIIDNSNTDALRKVFANSRAEYIFNNRNIGFGRAHNQCMARNLAATKYHLVLNPDVVLAPRTLEKLFFFMESNPDVGMVMPKVLDDKNQVQFLCKRLPDPLNLMIRRFGFPFVRRISGKRLSRYEMREKDYNASFEAPYFSGCFMFIRAEALKKVGLFDERFFMYMEDTDISRRIHEHYRTVYYPEAHIVHSHARDSYQINRLLLTHIVSAIKYFNKWGWFFDRSRTTINRSL